MAVRIAMDLDLFDIIARKPSTLAELTEKTNVDSTLLKRILRMITAIGYLQQREVDKWEATPLTHAATMPPLKSWMIVNFDKKMDMYAQFPAWLKQHEYKTGWLENDNIYLQIHGTDLWNFYEQNPEDSKIFDSAMSIQESFPSEQKPPYPFPVEMDEIKNDPEAVTLVDVGGGAGQAIQSLKQAYPNLPGRFILQDLPKTIQMLELTKVKEGGFETMVHHFFQPQPIKGAKYYHLRRVLHDWNDGKSLEILAALRPALDPAYSRLLIEEFVLPDVSPGPVETQTDLLLMMCCDGRERSESEWRALLGKAGFKIEAILRADAGTTAIIEASIA
jgi:demethylsterigmatocystin 6-O-methyltransferase